MTNENFTYHKPFYYTMYPADGYVKTKKHVTHSSSNSSGYTIAYTNYKYSNAIYASHETYTLGSFEPLTIYTKSNMSHVYSSTTIGEWALDEYTEREDKPELCDLSR